jgi:type I restriction enzyme, S subunit
MKYGLSDSVIEAIQGVLEKNPRVDKAFIFGSRAKGNFKEGSDIDLALKGDLTAKDILDLNGKLEELNLPYKIDLVNYDRINEPALREHVDRVGTELYSRWNEFRLGAITTKIGSGATPIGGGNSYKNEGISLVRSQNVLDLEFSYNGLAFIDDDQADQLKNVSIESGDVLLNITGDSVARVCSVPDDVLPARVNQHVAIIRANREKVSHIFLLYQLYSKKDYLLSISEIGGTRRALTKGMLEELRVELPPLSSQHAIGSVLESIDSKIDLLHRQNKTLEQLAETLFRQWFVEEAEESWNIAKVSDVAEINSSTINGEFNYATIEYLDTGSITAGSIEAYENYNLSEAPSRAQRQVKNNDIVYSLVRPIQRHYGLLHDVKENTIVSTGFCVIRCKRITPYFLYILLTQDEIVEYLDTIAEGSTSAYPSLRPSDIANLEFRMPPQVSLEKFGRIVESYWEKRKSNSNQISTLIHLRDSLLPKLMNGEVRIELT